MRTGIDMTHAMPRARIQPHDAPGDVTRLLLAAGGGDRAAWSRLVDRVYPELKRLARGARGRPREHPLCTTALVHECYLRLSRAAGVPRDHDHLRALAVRIMRQVLTDHPRERLALKRGGGESVTGVDAVDPADRRQFEQLVEIDDALRRLAQEQPRQAQVFEFRYFGGLNDDETAEALAISPRTAHRDWHAGRAWLARELGATTQAQ
jgi:RNA polymerase sigma factor (TIGR02999 family)